MEICSTNYLIKILHCIPQDSGEQQYNFQMSEPGNTFSHILTPDPPPPPPPPPPEKKGDSSTLYHIQTHFGSLIIKTTLHYSYICLGLHVKSKSYEVMSLSTAEKSGQVPIESHMYIYIYMCVCVCVTLSLIWTFCTSK